MKVIFISTSGFQSLIAFGTMEIEFASTAILVSLSRAKRDGMAGESTAKDFNK